MNDHQPMGEVEKRRTEVRPFFRLLCLPIVLIAPFSLAVLVYMEGSMFLIGASTLVLFFAGFGWIMLYGTRPRWWT
ncbi:hypothetical protein ACERK3_06570 [Phycisphaerales bacterium AB-hyl4]|uniref:Uncharacterized protein n=1 Tax=Natronomicrosphaera hydrolytica TaxID=3242702 RepID=A0ABV4U2Z6_9BACT